MAKTQFLQIRLTAEDRRRIDRVAAANHLESSTWARQVILRALEEAEAQLERSGAGARKPGA